MTFIQKERPMSKVEPSSSIRKPTVGRLVGGVALILFGIIGAYGQVTKPASSSIFDEAGRGPQNAIAIVVGAVFVIAGVGVTGLVRGRK
jgi:uncharacterized membrane protein YidH (DUF202 family)